MDTKARVIKELQKWMVRKTEITPSKSLDTDLQMDSLDMVEMAMAVEEEFNIEIPDETIEKWEIVADIIITVDSLT